MLRRGCVVARIDRGSAWLPASKCKVTAPDPGSDYLQRAALLRQVDSVLERRLTVLRAPAGFGKTTVLADVGRRKRQQGVVVGWLSVDEDDAPSALVSHLACAFVHGGLDLALLLQFDGWSSSPIARQMGMLVRTIELLYRYRRFPASWGFVGLASRNSRCGQRAHPPCRRCS